eukprot:12301207-Ditylum_brightwellii.AAC.2
MAFLSVFACSRAISRKGNLAVSTTFIFLLSRLTPSNQASSISALLEMYTPKFLCTGGYHPSMCLMAFEHYQAAIMANSPNDDFGKVCIGLKPIHCNGAIKKIKFVASNCKSNIFIALIAFACHSIFAGVVVQGFSDKLDLYCWAHFLVVLDERLKLGDNLAIKSFYEEGETQEVYE